ncbi:MAG: hypothetical protein WA786_07965 [Acidimicrobiales bacterium]
MTRRAVSYISYGQIFLAIFLGVCVLLHPGFVLKADEGGMSNYGIHLKTSFAYSLSLGLPVLFSYLAVRAISSDEVETRRLAQLLRVYCGLVLATLLSTYVYSLDAALRDFHFAIGVLLTVFQTVASLWMYRVLRRTVANALILSVQLVGFVLETITVLGALHLLFLSQVLTSGAFALLLVRTATSLWQSLKAHSGS